jgi:uncharacterized caspase-like protein
LPALVLCAGLSVAGWTCSVAAEPERQAVSKTAPRLALVIGNANYKTLPKLRNPANDARVIAAQLRQTGFEVTEAADLDLPAMKRQVESFATEIEKRGRETVSVVYYAGHGFEQGSVNYIVPVSADLKKRADMRSQAVAVAQIAERLAAARNQLNILVLDACRDNPFAESQTSATTGLVPMGAIYGVFIASSTASGKAALDGDDDNSPYTAALSEAIAAPGEKLEDVFKRVRRKVRIVTNERQIPWESTSLEFDFYFLPPAPPPTPAQQLLAAAKETGSRSLYALLAERFPDSPEAQEAAQIVKPEPQQANAAPAPAQSPAVAVLARARQLNTVEGYDLVVALFPTTPQADEAKAEAARLREVTALDSAGPTLEGRELVSGLQTQLMRLSCAANLNSGQFDGATIQGLRQASLLTDDRFLWYRSTMAALRALQRVGTREGCAANKLSAVPQCLRVNNEDFCR